MSLLEKAIAIAVEAHRGQKRRSGEPYIMHPLRVMCRVNTEPEQIVAALHDVVEDTNWSLDDLKREGFSEEIVAAVDCLTKREGEPYEEFVSRAGGNPLARQVKLADLEDNMDVRPLPTVTTKDLERLNKYMTAWRRLKALEDSPG